jgi:hypothetical protein
MRDNESLPGTDDEVSGDVVDHGHLLNGLRPFGYCCVCDLMFSVEFRFLFASLVG